MWAYLVRRLLLIFPTVLGIITINFFIIQFAPGGPVEQMIAKIKGTAVDPGSRITGTTGGDILPDEDSRMDFDAGDSASKYRGAKGLDPEFIKELEVLYGFDKPVYVRYVRTLRDFLLLKFGDSYFRDRNVIELIRERLPVSISLGVWTTLIIYSISIPLGVAKAVRDGTRFDVWTSGVVVLGSAIPGFLFAILLVILFAGGSCFEWFPLQGLVSENWSTMGVLQKIVDYLWHMVLPITALTIGGFAFLTMLTKNSFLEQIHQQYVMTAYSKGLTDRRVLYGHVFRNAMLIVIAGFPRAFIMMFFTGSFLIEVIFNLNGMGLLGFNSAMQRDYPVMFGSLYIFGLLGLFMALVSDMTYTMIDPRIDFEGRG